MAISARSLRVGHFGDRGVGDQHGAAARQHQRDAHDAMAGLRIDAAPHVLERDREIAGDAGDHGVGVAERDHAGGEMIAVLVDQALAVALQVAVALQPLVEIGGIAALRDDIAALMISMPPPSSTPSALRVSRTRSSRPTSSAVPSPWCTNVAAARITCSSSPSAKTTRRGRRRKPLVDAAAARRRSDRAGCAIAAR